MTGKQMRTTVRLRAAQDSGRVMLRRLNRAPIMCDLLDISEMGCRCVARVRINDWSDAEKWRLALRSGELYEAEITFDPYIEFIRLPIEIRSSIALPGDGFELGLAFFDLEPDHREMLNKAMISIATEKIKQSKGLLKRDVPVARPIEESYPMNSPHYPSPSVLLPERLPENINLQPDFGSEYNDEFRDPSASSAENIVPLPEQAMEPKAYADVQETADDAAGTRALPAVEPARFFRVRQMEEVEEVPAAPEVPPSAKGSRVTKMPVMSPPRLSAFARPNATPKGAHPYRSMAGGADEIIPVPSQSDDEIQTAVPIPEPELEALEAERPRKKLGAVLNEAGRLSRPEIHSAISSSRHNGERLGEYLVREGKLSPMELLQARSAQTGIAWVDLDVNQISVELLELFPFSKMKRFEFLPFELEGAIARIASGNPLPRNEIAELSRISGRRVEQYLCLENIPRDYLKQIAGRFERHRRAYPRFKISLPMSFQCSSPDGPPLSSATFRGRTLDISQGGMQVTGPVILGLDPKKLSPGQLRMMVTIGAVPSDIVGVCETRHLRLMRNSGGGTSCVYGLKLDQMSPEHRDILQGMIARVTRAESGVYSDAPSN